LFNNLFLYFCNNFSSVMKKNIIKHDNIFRNNECLLLNKSEYIIIYYIKYQCINI